jgi:uncharacterized protein YyaL (SSP411 family)
MKKLNRLAQASSPYLRQHADNPVDWHEWSEEALNKAKQKNMPILISIGYAACHWCHVMAHESFSDEKIASYMNDNFICIKVDREERPDIDHIYMDAAQIVNGQGGWPLNAIALPDGRPFYAATYFPPHQWLDVLQQLQNVYVSDPERVQKVAESITNGINALPFESTGTEQLFSQHAYHKAFDRHIQKIDFEWGGYNKAPKFMMPTGLEFFLQYYYLTKNPKALEAVLISIDAMARGGLNDQIGGGFARYSTDERWLVPHFEKMLYDNAQLISLYAKAFQLTQNSFYKAVVEKTIAFAERELRDSNGGFYASIDADSEHEEGKFYVFTKQEIETVVDDKTSEILLRFYNITEEGNWENGKNILHYTVDVSEFAKENGLVTVEFETMLQKANEQLFAYRSERIRPTTDDKILCSWNALMISGYVNAFKATGNTEYKENALQTSRFIYSALMKTDGSLYRVFKDGKASVDAFLDDYSLLASAWIDLYEITFDIQWLQQAKKLTGYVWLHFGNKERDMFHYTSDTSEGLIARKYEYTDNVIPASNSVLAHTLYRLGVLFEKSSYIQTSEKMLAKVLDETIGYGSYYANWAQLLGKFVHPSSEIAIVGNEAVLRANELQKHYLPVSVFAGGELENLPLLQNRYTKDKTMIYVCVDKSCSLPVANSKDALELIH